LDIGHVTLDLFFQFMILEFSNTFTQQSSCRILF